MINTTNGTRLGAWLRTVTIVLTMALVGAALAPVAAQEISPEQLALARKYVDMTNKIQLYEVILVTTAQRTSKVLSQQNPDVSKSINAAIGKVLDGYKGKNDELFNQLARIYATSFTKDELQQIVDFYSTPTGQKLADATFNNQKALQQVVKVYSSNLNTEFLAKVRAELKTEGVNL
ncbi:MAG: DUF2059 domain-containing protein [Devosia sp.]